MCIYYFLIKRKQLLGQPNTFGFYNIQFQFFNIRTRTNPKVNRTPYKSN